MSMHQGMVEGAGGLPLAGLLAEMSDCFMHNMCVYILYVKHEDYVYTYLRLCAQVYLSPQVLLVNGSIV